ncbi:MAG: hypothetical protein IPM06_21720 [Rhizobiales bacterium]|nr:hypothetical protein [Hyphomicrobiales bacterium]
MFYHKNVAPKGSADRVEFVQTEAMLAGNRIDDALTQRIAKGTPLPAQYAPYEPMAAMVLAAPGVKYTSSASPWIRRSSRAVTSTGRRGADPSTTSPSSTAAMPSLATGRPA